MTGVPIWQVDAFAERPFTGNPAAVCLLEEESNPSWMQSVAAEMNLSETAFVRPLAEGFELRWYTPTTEVDLCGHATLAAAHMLWSAGPARAGEPIRFHTPSGILTASRSGELIELDFPAIPADECTPPDGLLDSLDVEPTYFGRTSTGKCLVVVAAEVVRSLRPDFRRLAEIADRGVIVTAISDDARFDFISRFFAPAAGIDEDPVTGAAHCCLGPYWGERLGKTDLVGFQTSTRGGIVRVRLNGQRVIPGGRAVTVLKGELVASG
jgi:PhzF family phenazine biosynthesis protein